MITTKSALLCSLLVIPALAIAGHNGIFRGKKYINIENREEHLDLKRVQILGITLWGSTLQDAQEMIGITPIRTTRYQYGGAHAQVCYAGHGFVLLLNSPDPGDRQLIQTVIISNERTIPERTAPCTVIAKDVRSLQFAGGIRLGMSSDDVIRIWGEPSKIDSNILIFDIRRITKEYFTDDVSLYFEFKNNRLVHADLSRTAIH